MVLQLYDPQELLSMESKVASGYVVLMGASGPSPELDRGTVNLAFLALIEGNVIDACFGVQSPVRSSSSNPKNERAVKIANDAKNMLNESVRSSDGVRRVAVEAYGKAFQVVMQYNDDIRDLNCLTACFQRKPLYQKAENSLRDAFRPLIEAIHASG